jgi:hypothetical protein
LAQHKTLPSRFEIKAMVKLGRKIFTKKPSWIVVAKYIMIRHNLKCLYHQLDLEAKEYYQKALTITNFPNNTPKY